MNRTLIFIILFCFSSLGFSQTRDIPATLVTQNNDTVALNMVVEVNLFRTTMINELSIIKRVKYKDSLGKKRKIEAKDVKRLLFTDLEGKKRVFVYDGNKRLQQVIYEGITKAYRTYYANPYDGAVIGGIDIYDKNGKRVKVGPFSTSTKALKKAVEEIPELVAIIDEKIIDHEDEIILVLSKYDNEYLKK